MISSGKCFSFVTHSRGRMETGEGSDRFEKKTSSTTASNGAVDITGKAADKRSTGGWKASPFIILNEMAERVAYYSIAVSLVSYLVLHMHQPLPDVVTVVTNWAGAAFFLTVVGAFVADSYLGRFRTIVYFSCIYALGMVLLTLSATLENLHPPPCFHPAGGESTCQPSTRYQNGVLYLALSLIAVGTGGIKSCVSSFGADQFDEADGNEAKSKYAFFNWFFFAINIGALLGITVMVYVQVKKGYGWGFGVPTAAMAVSILVIVAGVRLYRYQPPTGSAFTRFAQVLVASLRNHFRGRLIEENRPPPTIVLYEVKTLHSDIPGARKLDHTNQYSFLDKAAMVTAEEEGGEDRRGRRWRVCTVTQVEEFKSFVRVLPIWLSTITLSISYAQTATFFIAQALTMDRTLSRHFTIPQSSIPIFANVNALILVPIYEGLIVPLLRTHTGHCRGITSLQRMGVGLFLSIFALMSAAIIETRRRNHNNNNNNNTMSVYWLVPQFFLMGGAEVFTYVGQLEFFYDEATDGTRSLSSAMFLTEIGIGSWMSSALVKAVVGVSGGKEEGWLRNDLDESRLDYFYWILFGLNAVNFLVFLVVSEGYKSKGRKCESVGDEALFP